MSIWTSIPEGAPLRATPGIPGEPALELDVAIAPSWNNRTRIAAWNDATDLEIQLEPAALEELIRRLQLALAAEQGTACSAVPPETIQIINHSGDVIREVTVPHGDGMHIVEIDPPVHVSGEDVSVRHMLNLTGGTA